MKVDYNFIKSVARDLFGYNITDADADRAHEFAIEYGPEQGQGYYDGLKEFFAN